MKRAGALLGLLLLVPMAHAVENSPPPEWAGYREAVRKADAIADNENRCLAYPDPPGNRWQPGAAKGRCAILRAPIFSLDDIDRLLAKADGPAELDRRYAALLDAHYRDPAQRDQIFVAFKVFDGGEHAGTTSARWLSQSKDSAYAHLAVGSHLSNAGWKARGQEFSARTPGAQLQQMQDYFLEAVPHYVRSMEIEPRLSVACHDMAGIGRMSSDKLQRKAMSQCLKIDPDSYFMALEMLEGSRPRWGGSEAQMRSAVAYAQARVQRNPAMGALLGEALGDSPSLVDTLDQQGLETLRAAALAGPSGALSREAGRAASQLGDKWTAAMWYGQASRFRPREDELRYFMAARLADTGDLQWAVDQYLAAIAMAPDVAIYRYHVGRHLAGLDRTDEARSQFRAAMRDREIRPHAMEQWCQTFLLKEVVREQADACTRQMIAEFPTSGEGWRLRAYYLYWADDPHGIEAIDQFVRFADRSNPAHLQTLGQVAQWRQVLSGPGKRR